MILIYQPLSFTVTDMVKTTEPPATAKTSAKSLKKSNGTYASSSAAQRSNTTTGAPSASSRAKPASTPSVPALPLARVSVTSSRANTKDRSSTTSSRAAASSSSRASAPAAKTDRPTSSSGSKTSQTATSSRSTIRNDDDDKEEEDTVSKRGGVGEDLVSEPASSDSDSTHSSDAAFIASDSDEDEWKIMDENTIQNKINSAQTSGYRGTSGLCRMMVVCESIESRARAIEEKKKRARVSQ